MSNKDNGSVISDAGREGKQTTISDFAEQWQLFSGNTGHFASREYFQDILGHLLDIDAFRGKRLGEIGSGTGRFVTLMAEIGADHIVALEPARSFEILKDNTKQYASKITYVNDTGEKLTVSEPLDYVISLGVISYIPDPLPTFEAVYRALGNHGKFAVCLMSYEGNRLYYHAVWLLRRITTRIPNRVLLVLSRCLVYCLDVYIALCKVIRLPLHEYMRNVISKFSRENRVLLVFDQLNPSYAKFYKKAELEKLFHDAGFKNVELHHRYGYSWVALGEKLEEEE